MLKALTEFDRGDIVVYYQRGVLTRQELRVRVEQLASALRARGLKPGDRVLLLLPNSLELLVAMYACLAAGLLCVPVNTRAAVNEVTRIAGQCRPRLCLADAAWQHMLEAKLACPVLDASAAPSDEARGSFELHKAWPDRHPAILYFTSGSTGQPKGAVYTHGTLRACSEMYRAAYGLTATDRSILCHCMAHNFMFSQMTLPLLDAGGSVHIVDFGDVEASVDALRGGATILMLIPWLAFDLARCLLARGVRSPAMRLCLVGGDRVPDALYALIHRALGVGLSQNIGLTETNTYAVDLAGSGLDKPGSVGLPLPGVRVKTRCEDGGACMPGETGQIWVQSPAAMRAYWENDALSRATAVRGWIATGDLGHLDEDGVLWFDARGRHIIIRDGDNIYPGEVERAIARHPHIAQVTVFGVADGRHGERVVAAVTMRDNYPLRPDRMRAFLSGQVAANKLPSEWLVMSELPQNINAKIDLQALLQTHAAGVPGATAD